MMTTLRVCLQYLKEGILGAVSQTGSVKLENVRKGKEMYSR